VKKPQIESPPVQRSEPPAESPSQNELVQLVALINDGRHVELEVRSRALVTQYPASGIAWKVLGISLLSQRKDAMVALQKAAELLAGDAEVHSNLGIALQRLERYDDAMACYHRALAIRPDLHQARNNLGIVQADLGQLDDAVASYRAALKIKPDYAEAHNNLGVVLKNLGRLDEAVACYLQALAAKPGYAEAHSNLSLVLKDLGQLEGAVANSLQALKIRPDYAEAHINLGNALHDLGRLDEAVASYRRAVDIKPTSTAALSNLLLSQNYLPDQNPGVMLACARAYGDLVARQARQFTDWQNAQDPGRCLRVGLVSGDLRNHPVGYFIDSVLAALKSRYSGRLKFFAYSNYSRADATTERIRGHVDGWHTVAGLSDGQLAGRIRHDAIDILIDLSGHTAYNRLPMFGWKPAPVQASWLGYFATTGVAAIDYFVADPFTLPVSEDALFTETIWRLPETRLCFTSPNVELPITVLPALNNGYITFGCFNNLTKVNDAVVALWSRVLGAVADSRLFLKASQLNEISSRQSIVARFAAHGIEANRLILEGASPRAQHLAAYNRVDIVLDPFPSNGGATSAESLWMGVPVLTLAGERVIARQGVSLLINAGLPEWVAANKEDYLARAVLHSGDLNRLADMRAELRQQVLASPLFDAPRFAGHFEAMLRGMWTQWCSRKQVSFSLVPPSRHPEDLPDALKPVQSRKES
jgi:predicted O-linked N-acetylglucosamine transferase (SPINDLY family)